MKHRQHDRSFGWLAPAAVVLWLAGVAHAADAYRALDLSAFSNVASATSPFPQGRLTFGGVPFQLAGRIAVSGLDAARHGEFFPTEVAGIPAGQKAQRVHLLAGALHGRRDGRPLANVVLRFKNGEMRALRLAFGVQARNVVEEPGGTPAPLADPNSRLAWRGSNDSPACLYQTAFDNPLPAEEIAAIDFVSLFSHATPLLFAVTLQDGGELKPLAAPTKSRVMQRAGEFQDAAYRRTLAVRVTEGAGRPAGGATALLSLSDDARTFFFGQYHANAAGEIVVAYPPQEAAALNLRVSSPGFAPSAITLSALGTNAWPEALAVRLERGTEIGGAVTDDGGQPVARASVIPFRITQDSSNQFTRTDLDLATTGPDGQWVGHLSGRPEPGLSFEVSHPEFHPTNASFTPEALLARSASIALRPHIRIAGVVNDAQGKPLARATVILHDGDELNETRLTDMSGRFAFVIREPRDDSASLIVTAPNLAPQLQTVSLNRTAPELRFALEAGQPFTMRLSDGAGDPLAGVKVSLFRWRASQALTWTTVTGDDGRFKWEHAPDGPVTWRFEKPGYVNHTHSMTLPMKTEASFTYHRPIRIVGRVLDAATKKPVEQFRARIRYEYANGSGSTSTTGRRGALSVSLGGVTAGKYTEVSVLLEATDYEPMTTVLTPPYGMTTNEYLLRRAKLLEGVALAPDGAPAPGAEVVLLDQRSNVAMDEPGKFRRGSSYYDVVLADANGRFGLTPKTDADFVFAAHRALGFAQVPFAQFTNSGKIRLEPWGVVQGTVQLTEKIEPYVWAYLDTGLYAPLAGGRTTSPLYIYLKEQPDANGGFVFEAVPPGERKLQLRYIFREREVGAFRVSHNQAVTVEPGRTNQVTIGGEGRTVRGKVIVKGFNTPAVDWLRGTFSMQLNVSLPSEIPPPFRTPPNTTPADRQRLLQEHQERMRDWTQKRSRLSRTLARLYYPVIAPDGSFVIPSVPAGSYTLRFAPHDPRYPNESRTLATLDQPVAVPEGKTPHDLGTFELLAPDNRL